MIIEKDIKKRNIIITIYVFIMLYSLEIIWAYVYPYREISPVTSRLMEEYLEIRDPENVKLIGYSIGIKDSYYRRANRVIEIEKPIEEVYVYYKSELNRNEWLLKKQVSKLEAYYEKGDFELHIKPYNNGDKIDLLVWIKVKDGIKL